MKKNDDIEEKTQDMGSSMFDVFRFGLKTTVDA